MVLYQPEKFDQAAKAGLEPEAFEAALDAAAQGFAGDDGETLIAEAFG